MEAIKVENFTKYEKARVIGARALQIAMGAPFLIKLDEKQIEELMYNPVSIAKLEFEKGIIPLTITRPLPMPITDAASVEEISTLGKKLVKEIQDSIDDESHTDISMEEVMQEMNAEDDDD